MTPDYKSKDWLLYCLNKGYGQRQMASLSGTSTPTIRSWLKKHGIKWRNISESLLAQSEQVSERAKKVWSDPEKRKKQSEKMIAVQAGRKEELSESAKKNWSENREAIITGIKRSANEPDRINRSSEISKMLWESEEYRTKITNAVINLWNNEEYQTKVINATRKACQTEEFSEVIKERWKDLEFRDKMIQISKTTSANNKDLRSAISKELWKNLEYRMNQMAIKKSKQYKQLLSDKASEKWLDQKYAESHTWSQQQFESACTNNEIFEYGQFTGFTKKIEARCKICGVTTTKFPRVWVNYGYCSSCGMSRNHREMYNVLKDITHCDINNRNIISPLELDIYIPQHKLAIEHHGIYWHSYDRKERPYEKKKHQLKAILCIEKNIKLIQVFEHEWNNNKKLVISMIMHQLGNSKSVGARSCEIKEITDKQANEFFSQNHLSGYRAASIILGLIQDGSIMYAMSFSRYRDGYEIIRMATRAGYHIRGGASKLLHHFLKNHKSPVYTYADLRYSNGDVYTKLGFKHIATTQPGYFYCKGNTILSRQQCQKHKLHKFLENFDDSLTESENMFNNGYRRVWDAGHKKFVLSI